MTARHLDWALEYAAIGWRVHPCRPGEKKPILDGWQKQATTDSTLIERWWGRTPDANIALATGPGSGIFVLDVDGPEGERALVELERQHGPLPEIYPQQWTGSGRGWQAFFAYPEGRTIRNSAGRLGPKIDTRGDGGFVVLPPSLHPSGRLYEWAIDRKPGTVPPDDAPPWLVDLLDPPEPPQEQYDGARPGWPGHFPKEGDRYALKALEAELAMVAAAPSGRNNNQLNASAHALFRFVETDQLPADVIRRGLLAAALHAGLPEREALGTISSAAKARGVGS
jgi:hypothetical protein